MKKYVKVKENSTKVTHLKIELYYDLGGMNYFTGKVEDRGYYLSVSPVTRGRGLESYTAFTGIKQNIKQVTRKSAKAEAEAEKLADDAIGNLIDYVCKKNGLTVWNRAVEENGDYQTIAHINRGGEIHYYVDGLPEEVNSQIKKLAEQEKEKQQGGKFYDKI